MNLNVIKNFIIFVVLLSAGFLCSYLTLSKIQTNKFLNHTRLQPADLPQVLSETNTVTPDPSPLLSPTQNPTPTPIPLLTKDQYIFAIIGDSMTETMGDSIDYVLAILRKKYPNTHFAMYNYGIGSENITSGLARFDAPFNHGTRQYPPIAEVKPDIIIVGSYAYNPLVPYDRAQHESALTDLVNKSRQLSGQVYMLAEIAPVENGFGTGPGGANWPADLANAQVQKIIEQMGNVFTVSTKLSVPVIDVFNKSKMPGSVYGNPDYVSTHDHIHYSLLGQDLTAGIIVNTIVLK
jgi:hypothetical protein